MSNQVYANERQKFFPCPGINTWATALAPVAPSATITVPFATPVVQQTTGQATVAAGICTFQQEGVYSIKAKVAFQDSASALTVDTDMRLSMILAGGFAANGTRLCDNQQRYAMPGAALGGGASFVIQELTYVGYFAQGDTIYIQATNNVSTKTTNILATDSGLIVAKLI